MGLKLNLGSCLAKPEPGWLNADHVNFVNPRSTKLSFDAWNALHGRPPHTDQELDEIADESRREVA